MVADLFSRIYSKLSLVQIVHVGRHTPSPKAYGMVQSFTSS